MSHEQNKGLVEALTNCVAECNHCATACLDEKDVNMLGDFVLAEVEWTLYHSPDNFVYNNFL